MQTKYIGKLVYLMGTTESKSDIEESYTIIVKYSIVSKCCASDYLLGF